MKIARQKVLIALMCAMISLSTSFALEFASFEFQIPARIILMFLGLFTIQYVYYRDIVLKDERKC